MKFIIILSLSLPFILSSCSNKPGDSNDEESPGDSSNSTASNATAAVPAPVPAPEPVVAPVPDPVSVPATTATIGIVAPVLGNATAAPDSGNATTPESPK